VHNTTVNEVIGRYIIFFLNFSKNACFCNRVYFDIYIYILTSNIAHSKFYLIFLYQFHEEQFA